VNFETDEALLTGESLPVRKQEDATFPEKTGPGDRLNVAYSSSNVTKGRAKGIVFATGTYTEIGAIAAQLRETKSKVRPVSVLMLWTKALGCSWSTLQACRPVVMILKCSTIFVSVFC
jgi:magnesium-transporting ATPase (P-type)